MPAGKEGRSRGCTPQGQFGGRLKEEGETYCRQQGLWEQRPGTGIWSRWGQICWEQELEAMGGQGEQIRRALDARQRNLGSGHRGVGKAGQPGPGSWVSAHQ